MLRQSAATRSLGQYARITIFIAALFFQPSVIAGKISQSSVPDMGLVAGQNSADHTTSYWAQRDNCVTRRRADGTRVRDCRRPRPANPQDTSGSTRGRAGPTVINNLFDGERIAGWRSGASTALFARELTLSGTIGRPRDLIDKVNDYPRQIYILADRLNISSDAILDFSGEDMQRRSATKNFVESELRRFQISCPGRNADCINRQANRFCTERGYERFQRHSVARNVSNLLPSRFKSIQCTGSIDLRFPRRGFGSETFIFVRHVDCSGGSLVIDTSGGRDGPVYTGRAGRIHLVIGNLDNVNDCIRTKTDGQLGARARRITKVIRVGQIGGRGGKFKELFQDWMKQTVEHSLAGMSSADIAGDIFEAKRQSEIAEPYFDRTIFSVPSEKIQEWRDLSDQFRKLRNQVVPPLWVEPVTIAGELSLERQVSIFFEGNRSTARLGPTDLLVRRQDYRGESVLGLLNFDPSRPERMELSNITIDLTVDPRARLAAEKQLADRNLELDGQFTDWRLTVEAPDLPGIRKVEADGRGNELVISLELDTGANGIQALQRLAGTGLPLTLNWQSVDHPDIKGVIGPLNLSFGRQNQTDLYWDGETVVNRGTLPQKLDFYKDRDGDIRVIDPALVVAGQASEPIRGGRDGEIPPHAVTTIISPTEIPQLFGQLDADGLLESIQIVNLLGSDPVLGPLEYVELEISYDGGNGIQRSDQIRLSSRGTSGSEKVITFFEGPSTARISAKGFALFEDGSREDLTIPPSSDTVLSVTSDLMGPASPADTVPN